MRYYRLFSIIIIVILLTFGNQTIAVREFKDFEGDTLVIGSIRTNLKDEFTIDIAGGDLQGDGWDIKFINSLPKERFKKIHYQKVGDSLSGYQLISSRGVYTTNKEEAEFKIINGLELAKALKERLVPGGELIFQPWSHGYDVLIGNEQKASGGYGSLSGKYDPHEKLLVYNLGFKFWADNKSALFSEHQESNPLLLETRDGSNPHPYLYDPSLNKDMPPNKFPLEIKGKLLAASYFLPIRDTILPLNEAGFENIQCFFVPSDAKNLEKWTKYYDSENSFEWHGFVVKAYK